MATTVKRKTKTNPVQIFSEHIVLKREAATITTRSNALKDRIKKWFLDEAGDEVYENEQGSKFFDFSDTISDGKDDYKGMELRRQVSTTFNEEKAETILKRAGVYEEALSSYVDQDKIARLHQEGKITDKQLDDMFEESERFAFWPVKGEVL